MSAGFTPAPWRVSGTGAIMATGGHIITMPVNLPLNEKLKETQAANARLIAAAPELYEAAESALAVLDGHPTTIRKLIAALAKARGES